MNHAIKEQISDNTLTVEVQPQPFRHSTPVDSYWVLDDDTEDVIHENELEDTLLNKSPISIGDTVNGRKVVGIEVEEGDREFIRVSYPDPDMGTYLVPIEEIPNIPEGPEGELITIKKWFWKYSLEEI